MRGVDIVDERFFLRQLLAEAPVDVIEQPLRDARAKGLPPEQIARLEEATSLALDLRATLTDRRRRERELSALYETAGDIIGIRDVERVLRAIVRRARRLLNADTAYLTLIDDEQGDTYMRVRRHRGRGVPQAALAVRCRARRSRRSERPSVIHIGLSERPAVRAHR
jgi:hypothetical protein